MCGRFRIEDWAINEAIELADLIEDKIKDNTYSKDIYPSNKVPVLTNKDNYLSLTEKTWGYPAFDNKSLIINARAETVEEKQTFRNGVYNNRIIVPAAFYYEWDHKKEKVSIGKVDKKTVYLAGFYDNFEGQEKFVILTTSPNESVNHIHDRMPLILEKSQITNWLSKKDDYLDLLDHRPSELSSWKDIEQLNLFEL